VRPAELDSAERCKWVRRQNYDRGQNVRWAHRLKVCVPPRQILTRRCSGLRLVLAQRRVDRFAPCVEAAFEIK
jgi:hypothetical protein